MAKNIAHSLKAKLLNLWTTTTVVISSCLSDICKNGSLIDFLRAHIPITLF